MKRSIVPARVTAKVEWRLAQSMPQDSSYFAEVAALETYKYFRKLLSDSEDVASLEAARLALAAALRDYRTRGHERLSLLFTLKAAYVNGLVLRAPRATHDAVQELGRMCAQVDATALEIATDLAAADLLAEESVLGAYLRAEGPAPEDERIRFRVAPEEALTRGVDAPDDDEEIALARALSTTIVLLQGVLETEEANAGRDALPVLSPALKRSAQVLSDLATREHALAIGMTAKFGPEGSSAAARAARAAVLAVVMGRAIESTPATLAQLAQASLLREIGMLRAARRPTGTGPLQAPAEGAAALAAVNATSAAARGRIALVYEALALETGAPLATPPSLTAEIVYVARKYVDFVEATSSARPAPGAIIDQLRDTQTGERHLAVLRLLASCVGASLPTQEQRRRLPSISGGTASHPDGDREWGAVHEGQIARTPLPHVLVFMLDYRLTGTIVFREPDGTRHYIYFRDGAPSLASPSPGTPPLGEILCARGQLRAAEIEAVVEEATDTGVRYGEYLVGEGRLSRDNLERALVAQLTARVAALANLPPDSHYEYIADENLLAKEPGGEEPLTCHALATVVAVVRKWEDRERIERALRRVESENLRLSYDPRRAAASRAVQAFAFTEAEQDVYRRIAAGNMRLVSLLRAGAPLAAVETVVSVLYMTRHLAVPGETRARVVEPSDEDADELSSRRLPLDASDENLVERVLGSLVEQKQAEEAVLDGDLERAEVHASEAAKLNPDERENRLLMAWLAAQQDPDLLHDAAKVALELLEKNPESEFGLLYYARICRDLGRHGEARRIYGDLLRLYPENIAGKKERAAL